MITPQLASIRSSVGTTVLAVALTSFPACDLWTVSHPMTELAAGDFVAAINTEIEAQQSGKRPAPGSYIARPGSP